MIDVPETRYAKSGDVHIAYQIVGDGPLDLVFVPGFVSHMDLQWDEPRVARFLERLASFSRLILFDKRGTGMSDPLPSSERLTLEQWVDDLITVMDAVGSERSAVFGHSGGGAISTLFAATHVDRTSALVLYSTSAKVIATADHPTGIPRHVIEELVAASEEHWGTGAGLTMASPEAARDGALRDWYGRIERSAMSPQTASRVLRFMFDLDTRAVLPAVRVPTLVLHRARNRRIPVDHARFLAEHIPGALLVELPGEEDFYFLGDSDAILDEVREFLTGVREPSEPERALATVLFTDIVGSTERAAQLGDHGWRDLVEAHHRMIRRQLERFRGVEVDTAGDGFFATFDGPARAVRCAQAIHEAARGVLVEVRIGLHTGECELVGDKAGGIAVHIGARISGLARPCETLVSRTVVDLVVGSGLEFEDRGAHALKGVPGDWQLFAVQP